MAKVKSELNPFEITVYQNIRTVLVTARQKVYTAFLIRHTLRDESNWTHYRRQQ